MNYSLEQFLTTLPISNLNLSIASIYLAENYHVNRAGNLSILEIEW